MEWTIAINSERQNRLVNFQLSFQRESGNGMASLSWKTCGSRVIGMNIQKTIFFQTDMLLGTNGTIKELIEAYCEAKYTCLYPKTK